jgi:hypothetical protein
VNRAVFDPVEETRFGKSQHYGRQKQEEKAQKRELKKAVSDYNDEGNCREPVATSTSLKVC